MSLFVTGTGTGVGKTLACSVILTRHGRRRPIAYWKPVATGSNGEVGESDADFVRRTAAKGIQVLPEAYSFRSPVSPHLAARLERRTLEPEKILNAFVSHALADARRNLLVEGVGGLLVPLTDRGYLLASLIAELALPCIVVASSALGTINHTLLTIEAARARNIQIAGVILSGPSNPPNRRAIERFGGIEVLAELPVVRPLTRGGIARAAAGFDRRNRLLKYFE